MIEKRDAIRNPLTNLYPVNKIEVIYSSIQRRIDTFNSNSNYPKSNQTNRPRFSEKDILLICYGDHIQEPTQSPLKTLGAFLEEHLFDAVNGIHILPFFQYSSDDGFSVKDYREVSPDFGQWDDIHKVSKKYNLMVDFVINHVSAKSEWFQNYLNGVDAYSNYFLTVDPKTDLSKVVRPRSTPLLTRYETLRGTEYLWTTFSTDQVDLNFENPEVLLEMIDVLLFYIDQGVNIIRLDAVAYLWKIPGTSCINLPQTHQLIKLFRAVIDEVAPGVALVTETNVPHNENISYFGEFIPELNSSDEAQIVYQFPLAPLILHTFLNGDSAKLNKWIEELPSLPEGSAFLNFTASHDGIGIRPVEQILSTEETQNLISSVIEHRGKVSTKSNPDGTNSVYELNISWYDALNNSAVPDDDLDIERFIASQVIMLSLAGIPGVYLPSLFGARNCISCYEESGRQRSINREKYQWSTLNKELENPVSSHSKIFTRYKHILKIRTSYDAFNPSSEQRVIYLGSSILSFLRCSQSGERILCLVNISPKKQNVEIPLHSIQATGNQAWTDLISNNVYFAPNNCLYIKLVAYQSLWLYSK